MAQKLLKDRGQEISHEQVETLKAQRIADLKQPESSTSAWIYVGYLSAFVGGLAGVFMGLLLMNFKKTLPNGERVYVYREKDRQHGKIIILISLPCIPIWWLLDNRLFLFGFLGPF